MRKITFSYVLNCIFYGLLNISKVNLRSYLGSKKSEKICGCLYSQYTPIHQISPHLVEKCILQSENSINHLLQGHATPEGVEDAAMGSKIMFYHPKSIYGKKFEICVVGRFDPFLGYSLSLKNRFLIEFLLKKSTFNQIISKNRVSIEFFQKIDLQSDFFEKSRYV